MTRASDSRWLYLLVGLIAAGSFLYYHRSHRSPNNVWTITPDPGDVRYGPRFSFWLTSATCHGVIIGYTGDELQRRLGPGLGHDPMHLHYPGLDLDVEAQNCIPEFQHDHRYYRVSSMDSDVLGVPHTGYVADSSVRHEHTVTAYRNLVVGASLASVHLEIGSPSAVLDEGGTQVLTWLDDRAPALAVRLTFTAGVLQHVQVQQYPFSVVPPERRP